MAMYYWICPNCFISIHEDKLTCNCGYVTTRAEVDKYKIELKEIASRKEETVRKLKEDKQEALARKNEEERLALENQKEQQRLVIEKQKEQQRLTLEKQKEERLNLNVA